MSDVFEVLTTSETPPGGWKATVPETGFTVSHYDFPAFIKAYESHCLANNIYLSDRWKERLLSKMCAENQPLWKDFCKRVTALKIRKTASFGSVMSFLNVLLDWSGQFVSPEQAEQRASICATCPLNSKRVGWGCGSCTAQYGKLLSRILGAKKTAYSDQCGSCQVCGCVINAAVWFPIEAQQAGLTDDIKEDFKKVEYCWKTKELGLN